MKKFCIITGIATLLVVLSGCLTTLYPIFTEKDVVFEPALLGAWKEGNDSESVVFEKATTRDLRNFPALQKLADKAYIITIKDDKGNIEMKYCAFLTQLNDDRFFDFYPLETPWQQQHLAFYKQHFMGLHSVYKFKLNSQHSFGLAQLKEDYLKELIRKKQIRINHEIRYDGTYVLTAPTEELQQYLLKYGNVGEAYEDVSMYNKQYSY